MLYRIALCFYRLLVRPILRRLPGEVGYRIVGVFSSVRRLFFPRHHIADAKVGWPVGGAFLRERGVPTWLHEEMLNLAKLEFEVNPTQMEAKGYACAPVVIHPGAGRVYKQLIEELKYSTYQFVVIAPWIKMGGADLAILHHLRYLSRANTRALLVLTESSESTWLSKVPDDIDVLDLGGHASCLSPKERELVLMRLLIQMNPGYIHIVNSRLAWTCLQSSGKTMSSIAEVYVSLYCDDYDSSGCPVGYAREFLNSTSQFIKKIITDNSVYVQQLRGLYGLPQNKFEVVRLPTDESLLEIDLRRQVCEKTVLWCGRFDPQKRPELLLEVAKLLPDVSFHVYGQAIVGDEKIVRSLHSQGNLTVYPPYARFAEVAVKYGVLLNTSAWDGLPNILVEAAASGLAIITSSVGGITDLVDSESGYLVTQHENPVHYAGMIERCFIHSEDAYERKRRSRQKVASFHTWSAFEGKLDSLFSSRESLSAIEDDAGSIGCDAASALP